MVDKLRGKYLFQKRGVYYFSKQIPKDMRQHFSQNPKLSDALQTYFKLKGKGKGEIFFRATRRAVRDVIALLKDRYLNDYSTTDAAQFRDHLLDRGLVSSTVKRVFAIIRAVINFLLRWIILHYPFMTVL